MTVAWNSNYLEQFCFFGLTAVQTCGQKRKCEERRRKGEMRSTNQYQGEERRHTGDKNESVIVAERGRERNKVTGC